MAEEQMEKMNRRSSESIAKPNLKEGDTVMAKTFPLKKGIQYPRYDGPYIIRPGDGGFPTSPLLLSNPS